MWKKLSLFLLFGLVSFPSFASVSPISYGIKDNKTGVERYWTLYKTHMEALRLNTTVDYEGIDSLEIEIPADAKSIPLGYETDFKGLVITVLNNSKDIPLFSRINKVHGVDVPKAIVDGNNFKNIPELKSGVILLVIKDNIFWVEKGKGASYSATRTDVRLLINGIAQNTNVASYNNENSNPDYRYYISDNNQKSIKNLTFIRKEGSEKKTFLLKVYGDNNLELSNITISTPEDRTKNADDIISISHSTHVTLRDVKINGTYSQTNKYGYGITLDCIWDVKCYNISGDAKWGLFGNNNINKSYLKNCSINRYDIHCYGRDITMEDCVFNDWHLELASVYGKIVYKRCTFNKYQPLWMRADYNSYVPFDIEIIDCIWYPTRNRNAICHLATLQKESNSRNELSAKNLPNIKIRGLKIYPDEYSKTVYLFKVNEDSYLEQQLGHLSKIDIKGLEFADSNVTFELCNKPVKLKNKLKYKLKPKRRSNVKVKTNNLVN